MDSMPTRLVLARSQDQEQEEGRVGCVCTTKHLPFLSQADAPAATSQASLQGWGLWV